MLLVIRVHLDLIIPWKAVHKGHPFEATRVVNHDISDGQWKFILRIGCVKIMKVDANSDLSVLLKHMYNGSNPVWVLLLSNEATYDEFMNFGFDCLHNVGSKPPLLLLNWLCIWFDDETMHGHLRIEARHVFIDLCKDIYIISYERYEVLLLCWR